MSCPYKINGLRVARGWSPETSKKHANDSIWVMELEMDAQGNVLYAHTDTYFRQPFLFNGWANEIQEMILNITPDYYGNGTNTTKANTRLLYNAKEGFHYTEKV